MNTSRWDKRSWLLAFGGGNCCGLMYLLGDVTIHRADTAEIGFLFLTACLSLAAFVLPGWLTVLAKRHFLLWGILPQTITLLWIATATSILKERLPLGLSVGFITCYAAISLCMVVPIAMYRSIQQREMAFIVAEEQSTHDAYDHAMQDAQTPQEGVWPPPPRMDTPPAG